MPRIHPDFAQFMNSVPVEPLEFPYLLLKDPGLRNKLYDRPVNSHFRFLLCPFCLSHQTWDTLNCRRSSSGSRAQHTFSGRSVGPLDVWSAALSCLRTAAQLFSDPYISSHLPSHSLSHFPLCSPKWTFVFLAYSCLCPLSTSTPPSLLGTTH